MNRIRELRQELGWRQADLAEKLSTKRQTVARYETGERGLDIETIKRLCEIFGVTSDYLLGLSEVRSFEISDVELRLLDGFRRLSPSGREWILHAVALAELGHGEKNGALPGLAVGEGEP